MAPACPPLAETGDRPGLETNLPKEAAEEMKAGADKGHVISMCDKPWWDWNAETEEWGWAREAPVSQRVAGGGSGAKSSRKKVRVCACVHGCLQPAAACTAHSPRSGGHLTQLAALLAPAPAPVPRPTCACDAGERAGEGAARVCLWHLQGGHDRPHLHALR